LQLTTHHEELQ